jgi:eukaryotic-like serine/threonine-protein kinase
MGISSQVQVPHEEGELPSSALIGAYRVAGKVGVGGMGFVYRARHALTDREVAIKVMREDQLEQDRAVDRMMREASILASVGHPGIPQFFECGILDDGRPWIAMELVDGVSLSSRMAQGVINPDDVIGFVGAVAEVLAAAHDRGVTHRDLKPDNILLTPTDGRFRVRVIDWGIAHHHASARLTNMNEAIGTPTYMAPEQARGGPTNGFCDVYGLGIVAYQALTGRAPFSGANAIEILVQHLNRPVPALAPRCPDAPYGLIELVEQMLLKTYEDRPNAAMVADTLRALHHRRTTGQLQPLDASSGIPTVIAENATAVIRPPTQRDRDD